MRAIEAVDLLTAIPIVRAIEAVDLLTAIPIVRAIEAVDLLTSATGWAVQCNDKKKSRISDFY